MFGLQSPHELRTRFLDTVFPRYVEWKPSQRLSEGVGRGHSPAKTAAVVSS